MGRAATSRSICATPITGAPRPSAMASSTPTPTTTPKAGSTSSTGPTELEGHVYYEPSEHGAEAPLVEPLRRRRARRRRPEG